MQIWLETLNISVIEKACRCGILSGVMTTPALLAAAPQPKETMNALLAAQPGPIAIEAGGDMIAQGKQLYEFSERIIVKVPITEQGLEAIHALSDEKIPVMASAIFQPIQALTAALAGAAWVAPSFSRMLTTGDNPLALLQTVKQMMTTYSLRARVLAIHPKTVEQIRSCLGIGMDGAVLREEMLRDLIETHELTAHAVEQFSEDWNQLSAKGWF